VTETEARALERQFADHGVRPVELTAEEVERYYERFCNGVLWPLFHYLIGHRSKTTECPRTQSASQKATRPATYLRKSRARAGSPSAVRFPNHFMSA